MTNTKRPMKRKAERRQKFIHSLPKLLVLDLNGVLIRRKNYPETGYTLRPYVREFLAHFAKIYRLAVWTSISKTHGKPIISDLFPAATFVPHPRGGGAAPGIDEAAASASAARAAGAGPSSKAADSVLLPDGDGSSMELLFAYYQDQCVIADDECPGINPPDLLATVSRPKPTFLKALSRIWSRFPLYSASNTILLDDTPAKTANNFPACVIHPMPFAFDDIANKATAGSVGAGDEELKSGGRLWRLLEARALHSGADVTDGAEGVEAEEKDLGSSHKSRK